MQPFGPSDIPDKLARWLPTGSTLAFPKQGMTSIVAFLDPGLAVFKRCIDPQYRDWLRREHEVLVALSGTNLPVPRALDYLDLDSEVWLVMTRLPGVQCADALSGATRATRSDLLRIIGAAMRMLHDTPIPDVLQTSDDWIDRRLAIAESNLGWCEGSPELLQQLRATRPAPIRPTLIHGDLNLENVLVANGIVTGFVDWAGGDVGDPRYDLALALLGDDELDDAESATLLFGYGASLGKIERRWFEDLYEFF
jgi:aminoglycoside phosphotransferase